MQQENRKKNFYCGDKVDYDEQCTSQCDRCVDAKGVDYGYLPEEEKTLTNMTCTCMRPSPGDFTANCRNCGFRIKDKFDHSLDALKSAVKDKYPEQTKCYCGHTTTCDCGPEQEITLEDIFNEEKRQGVKELIEKHKQEIALASKERI